MLTQEECRVLLTGQTALVTGASSGIGAAIALGLGFPGANVAVNYSGNPEGAKEGVKKITDAGGRALAFKADVSNDEQVLAMFQETLKQFGAVDILVSNAGV